MVERTLNRMAVFDKDLSKNQYDGRTILAVGGSIYAEHSFGLRHTIKPTESASRSWSPLPDLNWGHPDVC